MESREKYNWSNPSIPNDTGYLNPPFNNGSGFGFASTPIFEDVNVEEISSLFNFTLRPQMPNSTRLLTITGSEVFVSNDVLDFTNISLILKVKAQLEDIIFKRENNAVLDCSYMPIINGSIPKNYYIGYGSPTNDVRVVETMTDAASRLVAIFKDLGIDLTSDLRTNNMIGIRFRDIFMSAYVISMQIITLSDKKSIKDRPQDLNLDKTSIIPVSDTNIESEHKSIFNGIEPNTNGERGIDLPEKSDKEGI